MRAPICAAASGGVWCIANRELGHLPAPTAPCPLLSPSEVLVRRFPLLPALTLLWFTATTAPCHSSLCQHSRVPPVLNKAQRRARASQAKTFPEKLASMLFTGTPGALAPVVMPKVPQEPGTPCWAPTQPGFYPSNVLQLPLINSLHGNQLPKAQGWASHLGWQRAGPTRAGMSSQ